MADQEVLALIDPLCKVVVMYELGKKSTTTSKRASLASGAIRASTSCSAVVLLDLSMQLDVIGNE